MTITDNYDINHILLDLEVALQIDGKDYAEKDVDAIIDSILNRIIRQYQIDLHGIKVTDESLYIGKSRSSAVLFVENIALLHAKLCGYLQIVRFTGQVSIKPKNINFMGFTEAGFKNFFIAAMKSYTQPNINDAMKAVKSRFGSINSCIEKKMILIMIVCHEFGFMEMVGNIAEILYLGMML